MGDGKGKVTEPHSKEKLGFTLVPTVTTCQRAIRFSGRLIFAFGFFLGGSAIGRKKKRVIVLA